MSENVQDVSAMKVNALDPRFGGKRTLAPIIVKELGERLAPQKPLK